MTPLASWPFFAPPVSDEQDMNSALDQGDIVYDLGENKFYGKTGSGNNWVEFSSVGSNVLKYQIKKLTSPQSGDGTVSDLTFSNLVTGKHYRITLLPKITNTPGTASTLTVIHNSSTIAKYTCSNDGGLSSISFVCQSSTSTIFEAAASTVTFYFDSNSSSLEGNNSLAETYAIIEELPSAQAVTSF